MAIDTTYTVTIGNLGASYDITQYLMSFNVTTQVDLAEIGRSSGSMLLKNFNGAFTPGGGGTYGSVDWFNQAVLINGTTTVSGVATAFKLFHGIVSNFDLDDNGNKSYVQISFVDALTAVGRSAAVSTVWSSNLSAASNIELFYENATSTNPAQMPTLGGTNTGYTVTTKLLTSDYNVISFVEANPNSLASAISLLILSVGPSMVVPTTITLSNPDFGCELIDYTMTRNAADRTLIPFQDANGVGTALPFSDLTTGYDEDLLTNNVTITTVSGLTTSSAFNSSSTTKYGQRFRSYSQLAATTTAQITDTANSWINRFGTIEFAPTEIVLSSNLIKNLSSTLGTYWQKLLDIESVMWQPVQTTWTPTGCAQQTKTSVIKSRRISATPSETVVTLGLVPGYQYQSLILNDSVLGILDSSRIA